jgi:hypothetical protein
MIMKKALPVVLAAAGIIAIIVNPPSAKPEDAQQLSGSYYVTVFLDAPLPPGPYTGLVTYSSDGTAIANEILPLFTSATLSEDHGGWNRIGNGKFAVTFVKMVSSGGTFLYYIRNEATVELSSDTTQFSGRFQTDILNPDFSVLSSAKGTLTGKRIPVVPLPG